LDVSVVKKILWSLSLSPKPINHLAREAGVGWKTCEKYLEGLKLCGVVEETVTTRERVFSVRRSRGDWRFPHMSRIAGNKVELVDEKPSR